MVYGMQLPLSEAGERSTSSNHTSPFGLVLGRFSHTTCYPLSCALRACFSDRSVSAEQREAIGALVAHTHFSRQNTDVVQGAPSVTLRVPPPPPRQGRLSVYGMQLPPSETGEVPSNARR